MLRRHSRCLWRLGRFSHDPIQTVGAVDEIRAGTDQVRGPRLQHRKLPRYSLRVHDIVGVHSKQKRRLRHGSDVIQATCQPAALLKHRDMDTRIVDRPRKFEGFW